MSNIEGVIHPLNNWAEGNLLITKETVHQELILKLSSIILLLKNLNNVQQQTYLGNIIIVLIIVTVIKLIAN